MLYFDAGKFLMAGGLALATVACAGVRTPSIQEAWADPDAHQIAVNSIVAQISCEIGQAVRSVYYTPENKDGHGPLNFLAKWGAQVSLAMSVDERSSTSPGVTLNAPVGTGQTLTMGLGGTLSGEATRTDTQQRLYPISDFLLGGPRYDSGNVNRPCISKVGEVGTLFVESDSGFSDDLHSWVGSIFTGTSDVPLATQAANVVGMTHNIKFDIVTSGSVTPSWKLVDLSAAGSPLAGASRDRSQSIIITLGPTQTDPTTKQQTLSPAAQNAQFAQEVGAAVAQAIKTN